MEWLPIFVVAILIAILGLYSIVKKAVRDALKEHLSSKDKEDKSVFERPFQVLCKLKRLI